MKHPRGHLCLLPGTGRLNPEQLGKDELPLSRTSPSLCRVPPTLALPTPPGQVCASLLVQTKERFVSDEKKGSQRQNHPAALDVCRLSCRRLHERSIFQTSVNPLAVLYPHLPEEVGCVSPAATKATSIQ